VRQLVNPIERTAREEWFQAPVLAHCGLLRGADGGVRVCSAKAQVAAAGDVPPQHERVRVVLAQIDVNVERH